MGQSLKTINVRIPQAELNVYREYALHLGKSFSQLVRDLLAKSVMYTNSKVKKGKISDSFWDIDNFSIKMGDKKASSNIDKYVYDI